MKAYSLDLRQKIVDAYLSGQGSMQRLADRFNVARSFVQKLIHRYQHEGTLEAKPRGGKVPPKLAPEYWPVVKELVEADQDATLEELCEQLEQRTGVRISGSVLCRLLQKLKLTRKKKSLHATQAETERVQSERGDYWEEIRDIPDEDLIFLDETGVNLAMVRLYARALEGERAYGARPENGREHITLIGAIGLTGFLGAMTIDGSVNGDVFRAYIEQVLVPNLWEGARVVMDNSSIHKVEGIRELIEEAGARLIYLPPYSPDFNPIENCWSKLKEYLRSVGARSREALDAAIGKAINEIITLTDINHWFAHDCYCTSIT